MKQIRKRLTYANVMSSIAVFLILGGGAAFAASKVGSHQLKANSVTTTKIKANAITTRKIKKNAVTAAKIKDSAVTSAKLGEGAVDFEKIATGTNVIATATGSIAATQGTEETPADIPLNGTTTFTPAAGVVDLVSVEVRGNLSQNDTKACAVRVRPYINGNPWGGIEVWTAGTPAPPSEPNGQPLSGQTAPVGMTAPGASVSIGAKLVGSSANCTPSSTVSVAVAVTQAK